MRAYLNLGFGLIIILAFTFAIFQKQEILRDGRVVYLELAPIDPRSIMQGDYMRLRYELAVVARKAMGENKNKTGYFILDVDEKNVAEFAGVSDGAPINENQILFKYQASQYGQILITPESFLFQQGHRRLYANAQYGIFKIRDNEHLLVGLAGGDLKEIKPPKE